VWLDVWNDNWYIQLLQSVLRAEVCFCNPGDANSHFLLVTHTWHANVGPLPSPSKFVCNVNGDGGGRHTSFQKHFNLGCEFLMLLQCKPIANVVNVIVPVEQLFVCQINKSFDNFDSPQINGSSGFVTTEHRSDHVNEGER
jgi:hypothetical protein